MCGRIKSCSQQADGTVEEVVQGAVYLVVYGSLKEIWTISEKEIGYHIQFIYLLRNQKILWSRYTDGPAH